MVVDDDNIFHSTTGKKEETVDRADIYFISSTLESANEKPRTYRNSALAHKQYEYEKWKITQEQNSLEYPCNKINLTNK